MIKIDKITEVWETLEPEATITDLVDAVSRKYHIANDAPLFYAIKKAMNENNHLFIRRPKVQPIALDNELSKMKALVAKDYQTIIVGLTIILILFMNTK